MFFESVVKQLVFVEECLKKQLTDKTKNLDVMMHQENANDQLYDIEIEKIKN